LPDAPLHEIDIPILAEPEDAPADLFLGMPEESMGVSTRERVAQMLHESPVPAAVLEATPAVSVEDQLKVATAIRALPPELAANLSWNDSYPKKEQIRAVFDLVSRSSTPSRMRGRSVLSPATSSLTGCISSSRTTPLPSLPISWPM
jgi:hypothetical protein